MKMITVIPKFTKWDNVRVITSGKIVMVNKILVRNNNVGYRVIVEIKCFDSDSDFLDIQKYPITNILGPYFTHYS
jgi:hypothetical protein